MKNVHVIGWFGILLLIMPEHAAASISTGGMPWEAPLDTIRESITGPVAMVISLLGVTVAGGMLIFGGELGEFTRRIVMLVLVIGLLVSASSVVTTLYSTSGAMVG